MITKELVKRFDQYIWQNNNHKKKELRQYIKDYFTIVKEVPDAYVPRVFVLRQIKSGHHLTSATWTMNVPTVFPPTDLICLVLADVIKLQEFRFCGWTDTKSLVETLSPHLHEVNSYSCLKKLHSDYEYSKEIEQLVKTVIKPNPIINVEITKVDLIPSFEEEMIYYRNMS